MMELPLGAYGAVGRGTLRSYRGHFEYDTVRAAVCDSHCYHVLYAVVNQGPPLDW
jgi:hypothetical protein